MLDGIAWTVLGTAASRGAALLASLGLARMFDRVTFGELGVIENSVGMFAVLANLGLSLTTTKFVAKYRRTDPARTGRVLGLCSGFAVASALVVGGIVCLTAPWLAAATLGAPHLAATLRLAAAVLAFSAFNGVLTGALMGFQAFRQVARLNLTTGALTVPILVGGAAAGGLRGAVVGLIVVQASTAALQSLALRRVAAASGIVVALRGCWAERHLLASFSLPALINSSLISPVNWICMAMLVNQADGYAQMGLLHAVNPWFLLLMFLPGQLASVYFPMFEDAIGRGDDHEVRRLMRKSLQLNLLVCATLAAGMATAAEGLLAWCGPDYREGAWVLRVAMLTGLVIAAQQPLGAYLVSTANMWLVTACSAAWAAVFVAASHALLSYGALGVAAGRLLGYVVYAALVAALAVASLRRTQRSVASVEPSSSASTLPSAA
jgi:O-antigen/teichoic acid export membrane protein